MSLPAVDNLQTELAAMGASGTWHWDIAGDRLHADHKFAELYGLDPETALAGVSPQIFFSAIHPDDRPRIRIAVAAILAGADTFSKEFRVIAPDGQILWLHGRGQGHLDAIDEPVRFTGLLVDVTERKRTEDRLRIAQTAGGVGTFEYVDGFATASVSDTFCRLLGLHPAPALPSQTINGVLCGGEEPLIPGPYAGEAPGTLDGNFQIVRNDDGEHRWIERRGEIVREGNSYRLIGVIYDVTHAKMLEAQLRELNDNLEARVAAEVASRQSVEDALRQAQKMEAVGQLTGGVAHDFNNLLMAISSSLDLLRKRVGDDPQVVRLIDNALAGTKRGAALTQRMLAFARRQDLVSDIIAIPDLVEGMLDLMRRTLGPSWPVEVNFPHDLPPVVGDANQIEMAILNLAVNARDAMPGGGTIFVAANSEHLDVASGELAPGSYLKLSVIDTGFGMDEDTLARAVEPFFTTKGVGKGTGLGLSMIHGLAQQLGGTFTLESRAGEGTTASLWLPAATPAEEQLDRPSDDAHDAPTKLHRLKILAVDDDSLILMNTSALLEDLGHTVFEASSGDEALALFAANCDIDVIVTDHAMPGMTGAELAEQIEEIRSNVPLILATGYGELPPGFRSGAVKLGKPFSQKALADALSQAMATA
ncbi:PAS domain-containing protein [Sphingopyxis sp. R3-92]|uniref:PAS domain-containing protein n=1 Tax=Sphingopyxis sp. R3-92 TaxID=3158553 RepID=UPI003EE639E3